MIEEKNFYPITILKELNKRIEETLGNHNIILLRQLVEGDLRSIFLVTGIDRRRLEFFVDMQGKS